jgi:rhomboid family GlyGly-CTERM serine protease
MKTHSQQRFPWLTLAVIGLAVVASAVPALSRWLVFDRVAIVSGQWWRLMTGNWVHFSADHLLADSVAVGIAGALIERQEGMRSFWLYAVTAAVVGLAVFFLAPEVAQYGGLSGVACGAFGYLALNEIKRFRACRWLPILVLALLVAKVGWEYTTGRALFVGMHDGMRVLPLAHAAGLLSGAGYWVVLRVRGLADAALTERGDVRWETTMQCVGQIRRGWHGARP